MRPAFDLACGWFDQVSARSRIRSGCVACCSRGLVQRFCQRDLPSVQVEEAALGDQYVIKAISGRVPLRSLHSVPPNHPLISCTGLGWGRYVSIRPWSMRRGQRKIKLRYRRDNPWEMKLYSMATRKEIHVRDFEVFGHPQNI